MNNLKFRKEEELEIKIYGRGKVAGEARLRLVGMNKGSETAARFGYKH